MLACDDIMPTGWTPAAASSTLEEWTRTFSGRVHLAEGSNAVVLELPYSTEFGGGAAESLRVLSENMENLVTFWPTL